jgi:membrane-associated protein
LNWFDAQEIITAFGDWAAVAVAFVIFIETAFIFTSMLPGDSLLFLTGLALATSESWLPDWAGFLIIWSTAFSGTQVGYWIGAKIGPPLIAKERKFILNKATIARTDRFFENYGARAIVLARFVPILRALVPMLAGISKMDYRRFTKLNLFGATAWVGVFMVPGYWLGGIEMVKENLEITVLIIIIGTTLLLPLEILRDRLVKAHRARKKELGE